MNFIKRKLATMMGMSVLPTTTQLGVKHFVPDVNGEHLRPLKDGGTGWFREVKRDRRRVINHVVTDA